MSPFAKNSFFSAITLGSRFLSNAVLFILIARVLGAEEFGDFAFASSFVGIFLVIVDYGFNLLIVKEVAVDAAKAPELTSSIISGKLLLVMLSSIMIGCSVIILKTPLPTIQLILILWVSSILYSFGVFFNSIFKGVNKFHLEMYPSLLLNLGLTISIIALLVSGGKSFGIAIVFLVLRVMYFVFSYRLYIVHFNVSEIKLGILDGLKIVKETLPFGIHTILAVLYFQLDTVFLSYFKGNVEVGLYQAPMRLVLASMIICEVLISSIFPQIARSFGHNTHDFETSAVTTNKFLLAFGGWIAIFFFVYADLIIDVVYGQSYRDSITLMRLLSLVIFLRFACSGYAMFITVSDNQLLRAFGVVISLIVNVLLNVLLIPSLGASGAAIASIGTHIVLFSVYAFFSFRSTGIYCVDQYCAKILVVLALMLVVGNIYGTHSIILAISITIIFTILLLANMFNSRERFAIGEFFKKGLLYRC